MPVTDDVCLYEKMCLERFQSGLSWLTILRKLGWCFVGPTHDDLLGLVVGE